MAEHYLYRFFKSSWGIWVNIIAEAVPLAEFDGSSHEVEPGLFISLKKQTGILPDGISYLPIGLRLVASEMRPILARTGSLVICILEVELVVSDYQPEGVAYALAGWMIQKFHLQYSLPPVHFDSTKNQYLFALPKPTLQDKRFAQES